MEKIMQDEFNKEIEKLNRESEDKGSQLLVDKLDNILFDAIIEMGNELGYTVKPKDDITNEYLMELRNSIIEDFVGNFELKKL